MRFVEIVYSKHIYLKTVLKLNNALRYWSLNINFSGNLNFAQKLVLKKVNKVTRTKCHLKFKHVINSWSNGRPTQCLQRDRV